MSARALARSSTRGPSAIVVMTPITEKEVAFIRHFMGYDLSRSPEGYQLAGVRPREAPEIMVDSSLELIADSLKILGRVLGNSSSASSPIK